jgi:hypothetical protein
MTDDTKRAGEVNCGISHELFDMVCEERYLLQSRLTIAREALEKIEIPSCELQQGRKPYEIAREALERIGEIK